jgi:hypothetical protein
LATDGGPAGICSALWQSPELVLRMAGWPPMSTRAAGTSHWTLTHGCGFVPTMKAHPATV